MQKKTLICVVGARPNFMKIAPIMSALSNSNRIKPVLVHTGQHYDEAMKDSFFRQLGIPEPDVDLGVGSATHAVQTAEIMKRFEPVLDEYQPDAILVVGDVNSTVACALVAVKKQIRIIHVEAGLRSYDRQMPEEVNRVLTDQISDLMFTTEDDAITNLVREGISKDKIVFVGNVMIDSLYGNLERSINYQATFDKYQYGHLSDKPYALLTLHRPSNVDDKTILARLIATISRISEQLPVIFPVHPRTRQKIADLNIDIHSHKNIYTMPPLGYLELIDVMRHARCILTDSGGIQEESTALGVPCITLRENTERPITVTQGTNTVVGTDPEKIIAAFNSVMTNGSKQGRVPELWDGNASLRILEKLESWL